jgi:hypothetical protein
LSIAELQEVLKEQGVDVSECELHSVWVISMQSVNYSTSR